MPKGEVTYECPQYKSPVCMFIREITANNTITTAIQHSHIGSVVLDVDKLHYNQLIIEYGHNRQLTLLSIPVCIAEEFMEWFEDPTTNYVLRYKEGFSEC